MGLKLRGEAGMLGTRKKRDGEYKGIELFEKREENSGY